MCIDERTVEGHQSRWATLSAWMATAMYVLMLAGVAAAADRSAEQAGLERFNSLIGEWRGVAQPQRGSNRGAWQQSAEWVWDFTEEGVAIAYNVTDGKLVDSGRLTYDPESDVYKLSVQDAAGAARSYQGRLADKKLVLEAEPDADGLVRRITITLLNENRTLMLHEQRTTAQQRFFRVAEVGYTRKGVRLARPGSGGPECIVTGGAGTIPVSYEGKTYYVCCSGCKQAFEDDPAGILAEAAERRKQEQTQEN